MAQIKTLAEWLADRGMVMAELIEKTGLDRRVGEAIAAGRYTPSPDQRRLLAAALDLQPDEMRWGHPSPQCRGTPSPPWRWQIDVIRNNFPADKEMLPHRLPK